MEPLHVTLAFGGGDQLEIGVEDFAPGIRHLKMKGDPELMLGLASLLTEAIEDELKQERSAARVE